MGKYLIKPFVGDGYEYESYLWYQRGSNTKPYAYSSQAWDIEAYDPDSMSWGMNRMKKPYNNDMSAAAWKEWKEVSKNLTNAALERQENSILKDLKKKGYKEINNFEELRKKYGIKQKNWKWMWDTTSLLTAYKKFWKSVSNNMIHEMAKHISDSQIKSGNFDYENPEDFLTVYGSSQTVLHNYDEGKAAIVFYTYGDDDEAGHYAMSPVVLSFNLGSDLTKGKKPRAKPKAKKSPVKKPTAKAKAKAKPKYILGKKDRPTDLKKRKSPPYSAKQFPKGARKKGNNGKMWTIVTDKRGVKRWKA